MNRILLDKIDDHEPKKKIIALILIDETKFFRIIHLYLIELSDEIMDTIKASKPKDIVKGPIFEVYGLR